MKPSHKTNWEDQYPLNTFSGETQRELGDTMELIWEAGIKEGKRQKKTELINEILKKIKGYKVYWDGDPWKAVIAVDDLIIYLTNLKK